MEKSEIKLSVIGIKKKGDEKLHKIKKKSKIKLIINM